MNEGWRIAKAPWAEGGRLYSYLLPPELDEITVGDTVLVEGPKGQPKFLTLAEVEEWQPLPFPCKVVANAWSREDYEQALEEEQELSHHENYPKWHGLAARVSNGEDLDLEEEQG
jgi:hypothetical protein